MTSNPYLQIVIDGVTAASGVPVIRGLGAAAALSVSGQTPVSSLFWLVTQIPPGSQAVLGATGASPSFATTLGRFDVPGRYVVVATPNADQTSSVSIIFNVSADPPVQQIVSLGGGAAPTLGTIGGSGPATAAQNSWIKLFDSNGNAYYVPAWR